jgi:cyclic beta-1,2-glucan synthetase
LHPFISEIIEQLSPGTHWSDDQILREEIFSVERLEEHARSLAAAQPIGSIPGFGRSLGARLRSNEKALLAAYRSIAKAVDEGRGITPAAEWVLDNYHVVEEQIREIREDLPPEFYKQLPKLTAGPFAGFPRVFGIAWAFVAHTDSRFEPETLLRFVRAYQSVEPLTIGELWAVAITLRIVFVENLRRVAQRIVNSRAARQEADAVADRLLGVNGQKADPNALVAWEKKGTSFAPAFAVQLVHRLRDQDPNVTPALVWLDRKLTEEETSSERLLQEEHLRQGASNVTVRNIITSMRLMSDVDWAEFFESVSLVDETLNSSPTFAAMDFATRNLYRNAIEEMGRGSKLSELEIARLVLATAAAATIPRERDPGFHLIAEGRRALERAIGFRARLRDWPSRIAFTVGARDYVAAIAFTSALVLSVPLSLLQQAGVHGGMLWLLGVLGVIPAVDIAVALVNRAVTRGVGASRLPGLSLRDGVPEELRTVVAMPVMLSSRASVEQHLHNLEIHYLASPDEQLHFALLSDWADADTEFTATDDALLDVAVLGIARLNRRYGPAAGGERFLLLHRKRVWCESEQRWMGWERKRGKLQELNRLLRGATDTTYITSTGKSPWVPEKVRYVLTLDADTRLPRETPRRLIGKMAHPLNRPRFDPALGRVVEGYAILQPRVAFSLPVGTEATPFQRIFSGAAGVDPYAAAVSDVYQDLLGEGSFAGKGIYDIDAFEAALADRVPESTLLSHDLFEGIFARAGLASDVEVVEDFPSRYDVASMRQHRWVRGDWQLLPWIFGRRDRGAEKHGRGHSRLPLIGLWKMIDNLRRALSAPASLLALLVGWMLPLNIAVPWCAFILLALALPTLLPLFAAILPRRSTVTLRSHLRALRLDVGVALGQTALLTSMLGYQAWLMTDAIGRALWRMWVSHRHLLEWIPADLLSSSRSDFGSFYKRMGRSVLLTLVTAVVAAAMNGGKLPGIAVPFLMMWLAAPFVAWRISRTPPAVAKSDLSPEQQRELRLIARRTWRFFETFVTADDNHLPPDNFQEDPQGVVAHRTSPTNIGLYLLSTVAARDFGWCGLRDALDRIEETLDTMVQMQKHRGHLFNWYDTRDLRPLDPRYVSSVDSGNLAAHLITLAGAFREWQKNPAPPASAIDGLADALDLARAALREFKFAPGQTITLGLLETAFADLESSLRPKTVPLNPQVDALREAAERASTLVDMVRTLASENDPEHASDLVFWVEATRRTIDSWRSDLLARDPAGFIVEHLESLANIALELASAMEFNFLLDTQRKLLSIGYRATDGTLDDSCYDLLASEARLASFIAIAKGDIPARHWFRLGRTVTPIGSGAALVSWSGSMFEYLMPDLVLRAPGGSLLAQTSRLIVKRQIAYGAELGLPWGVSESAYNARDLELTYQYSNFGVPGLGLKRGLSENCVVAPYATGLAAMIDGEAALANYQALALLGARGRYGFYEAVDFTSSRVPEDATQALVRAYMAHHQGMSIVAIANALLDGRMRERFHSDVAIQATELLLQERTPRDVSVAHPRAEEVGTAARVADLQVPQVRRIRSPHDSAPQTHLLSNGRYSVMVTAAGSGYSRWNDLAITRWREDATRDDTGSYLLLRDTDTGRVWSAGFQPTALQPAAYDVSFTEDRAEIIRLDGDISTTLEVQVSSQDDAEVRQVSLTNGSLRAREIEVTSYAELVLAPQASDVAHPAFSKMFVRTEFMPRLGALIAHRRRRAPDEPEVWVSHHAVVEGTTVGNPEFETDRAKFVGRGRELRSPVAMLEGRNLSGTTGTVLDAVFALRYRLRIPAGGTARIAFWTCVAHSRNQLLDLADKHRDSSARVRAATLAWTQAQVQLRHLGMDASQANLFQQLAGHILYANPAARASADNIRRGAAGPAGLWSQGISGDLPIVLLRVNDADDMVLVRQLLQAHEYWGIKRLSVDLVILNERGASYIQDLQMALEAAVRTSLARPRIAGTDSRGKVFVLRTDLITSETRALLLAVARVVLSGGRGSLADQVERMQPTPAVAPRLPRRAAAAETTPAETESARKLEFFNGIGGFDAQGREYVVEAPAGQSTPVPWINVIANAAFGFQVGSDGGGYTWSRNSRENALTPWSNDPVGNRPGETFYLRDEESGELWTVAPGPIRHDGAKYSCAHGMGYTRFEHESHGLNAELTMLVPLSDPIKICRLRLRNDSPRRRSISVTAYVEWVLGPSRTGAAPHIISELDSCGALFARNPWNQPFPGVAFADLRAAQTEFTCDAREFLGRHGVLAAPAALVAGTPLSGRTGAGLDPCAALRTHLELEPSASTEIVFLLGEAAGTDEARALVAQYRGANVDKVLAEVRAHWDELTGHVQVTTPDRAFDIMMNGWLLYQTLACRTWARAGFYQASGAYGFRDQLQDAMALGVARPALLREQILRAASRQFPEGDVQHWWLPHSGQGVRTHISDDRVWLSYVTAHYVALTGDRAILDVQLPFLEGPPLPRERHDAFFEPAISEKTATLFEHCRLGLEGALYMGEHGLPLIGTGDWNDGMNRVGEHGRGESVWLGWFLHTTLNVFAPIAQARGELALATSWLSHATRLRAALEQHAWDGEWYRRGFFDDGTPLGSAANDECQIDAIAQSWSVISGAANPARAARAMEALDAQLLRRDPPLAVLFTPPFEKSVQEPGYVKAYPRGIRENGGQYTHAAVWTSIAFAMQGNATRAMEVFNMLNPIRRSMTRADVQRYKVEPYVVAADVYSEAPHAGRGGWTWYTGSAGWLYRAGLEWILGFRLRENRLTLTPCVPPEWPGFTILYRHRGTPYQIIVDKQPDATARPQFVIDGVVQTVGQTTVDLKEDGAPHSVHVMWLATTAIEDLAATRNS